MKWIIEGAKKAIGNHFRISNPKVVQEAVRKYRQESHFNVYEPIYSIYVRDDGTDYHVCEGGYAKMERVSEKLYQYTFKDLVPNGEYQFHFCVNNDLNDRFARYTDQSDYGFDIPIRIFRYPYGYYYSRSSIKLNLTEPNITVPPDGYFYDVTVSLDLTYYDENDPGNANGYAEYSFSAQRKYLIKNADDWDTFRSRLDDNYTYNQFSGETVCLCNDITVSTIAGSSTHKFCGTFDGQGHTLTFNYNGSGSDKYVAPFSFVNNTQPAGSLDDDPEVPATIKNLNVKSTIKNCGTYASGLIGQCLKTVNIENCNVEVDIDTANDYAGGFVGLHDGGQLNITGCTASGTIKTSKQYAGGFVASTSNNCNITDCVSSVTIDSSVVGEGKHGGFVGIQNKKIISISVLRAVFLTVNCLGIRLPVSAVSLAGKIKQLISMTPSSPQNRSQSRMITTLPLFVIRLA